MAVATVARLVGDQQAVVGGVATDRFDDPQRTGGGGIAEMAGGGRAHSAAVVDGDADAAPAPVAFVHLRAHVVTVARPPAGGHVPLQFPGTGPRAPRPRRAAA